MTIEIDLEQQILLSGRSGRAVMRSGKPKLNYEEPQTTPDGGLIWLRTGKIPLLDVDRKVIGVRHFRISPPSKMRSSPAGERGKIPLHR